MTIAIDFETYFCKDTESNRKKGLEPCSVDKLGPVAYTRHPLFDAYLVAVVGEGIHYVGHPANFDWKKLHGRHVIAHNMGFDGMVAKPYLDAHGVVPAAMDCTADLAVYFGHPRSLSGAMKSLFGTFVSKQIRNNMDGVRWEDLSKYQQDELIRYADSDSVNCLRIWDALSPKWPEFERRISRTNREMGWRGLPVDWNKASRNMGILAHRLEQLEAEIPWCGAFDEDGEEIKLGSRKAFNDACKSRGIPPPTTKNKKAESWIAWLEEYSEKATFAKAMAEHASVNKMLKTYETLFKRKIGGRVSYESLYFGAHTGRNSGSGGLNMMNLNKDAVAGTKIRETFSAAPGRILLNADLSQIEPRCYRPETLVLTRAGYKMMKDLTQIDQVWDGVAFVSHGGVITKPGVADVLINGSFSTDDHEIFTADNRKELAASVDPRAAWAFRAAGWPDLWKLACAVSPRVWEAYCALPVRLWARKISVGFRSAVRSIFKLRKVRQVPDEGHQAHGEIRETT